MKIWFNLIVVLIMTASTTAAEIEISVQAGGSPTARNPAHAAALAEWNSPMGRLTYLLNEQQSRLISGGQPGGSMAPVFRIKFQQGLPPELVAAAVDTGIDHSQARIGTIPWPWNEEAVANASPLSDQLTLLLGQRLRPAGKNAETP